MEIGFSDSMLLDGAEPSYLAILLGGRVGLKSVRVAESLLPKVPSPLEEADELFGRGEYALALSKYTQQTRIGGGAKTESHVKEGLCFAALNQSKEAVTAFEQAMSEGGEPWELIAAIQLWALKLKQKDYAEAENLFGAISVDRKSTRLNSSHSSVSRMPSSA